ncbi:MULTISPECIES: hypothetical protein [Brachybacterium]|uniref:hypothetical protein n=1 Tax=Brachybacterium TaxID=43668 RepID=UPI0006B662D5|nr:MULTISPECIES: hypothetical protein [Brachybacterium]GAP78940.1 hypothetical protein Y09_1774 [Brachybacterium sp. SW0106-09]
MRPVDELRDRLHAARRRAEIAGARADVLAQARAVVPELPRDADAGHLERAARRLVRRAAQDDFAREGITRIPVPEATGRAELRRADLASDAAFHAVVEDVLSAVEIVPSPLESDDAVALRDARASSDAYGLSPEVASDLASYLLGRAFLLRDEERDLDAYLDRHERQIREDMRSALVRLVRVPLELRSARERHNRIASGLAPEPAGSAHRAGTGAGTAGGAGGTGSGASGVGAAAREALSQRARSAMDHARAEAGRAALGALRSGAGRAFERYGRGGDGEDVRGGEARSAADRARDQRSGGRQSGEHRAAEQTVHDPRSD